MLRIISIKAKGYRSLDDDFEISLTNENRVSELELDGEMFPIDSGVYGHNTVAFVGANGSGKSSTLSLIIDVLSFLKNGRWASQRLSYANDNVSIDVMFYLESYLYQYKATFVSDDESLLNDALYCNIVNEELHRVKFDKNRGKANITTFHQRKEDVTPQYLSKSLSDTSAITELTKTHVFFDTFDTNVAESFNRVLIRDTFFKLLQISDPEITGLIFRLLDTSIESIRFDGNEEITYKRFGQSEIKMGKGELLRLLSGGSVRGFELYLRAIATLKRGGVFVVDEIENSFQKNIVYNLLFLFNSKKTNPNNAQLIFSTHYVEILDVIQRRDGIFVMNKENGSILVKNLSEFKIRPDKVKSRDFNNNVFGTFGAYDEMMKLKGKIANV